MSNAYAMRILQPVLESARSALEAVLPADFRFVVILAREREDVPGVVMFTTGSNLCEAGVVHLLGAAWKHIVTKPPDGQAPTAAPDGTMH